MNIPQRFQQYTQNGFYHNPLSMAYPSTPSINNSETKENNVSQYDSDIGSDIAMGHFQDISKPFTYQENFKTLIQGWIKKKTLNTTYQQRFFVLTPTRLCYFTHEQKNQLKGCFNLVSLLKYGISATIQDFEIKIKISPKAHSEEFSNRYFLQLKFNSKSALLIWYEQFNKVIKQLNLRYQILGNQLLTLYPQISIESLLQMNQKFASQYNYNYWNKLDISVPELCAYSSHLDILLLRNKNPVAYVSRFFMRSYYDHVALVIKSDLHETFIFEAIESRGVCLIDLQTFLKINSEQYEEIAFRKLVVKQTKQEDQQGLYKGLNLQRLENYMNSLVGKKYELSLSKLLLDDSDIQQDKQSDINSKQKDKCFSKQNEIQLTGDNIDKVIEEQAIQSQERTYFCSQLIADIYLKFGIIKQGKSKDFWPKDFEQNEIKFRQKAYLSPIMNVCLR